MKYDLITLKGVRGHCKQEYENAQDDFYHSGAYALGIREIIEWLTQQINQLEDEEATK